MFRRYLGRYILPANDCTCSTARMSNDGPQRNKVSILYNKWDQGSTMKGDAEQEHTCAAPNAIVAI